MNKMTLKEAQEVLEGWEKQQERWSDSTLRYFKNLLEAARVVEVERCIKAVGSVVMKNALDGSVEELEAWVKAKHQCTEALRILSDNQEQNEGN